VLGCAVKYVGRETFVGVKHSTANYENTATVESVLMWLMNKFKLMRGSRVCCIVYVSSHLNLPVVILRTLAYIAWGCLLSIGMYVSSDAEKSAGGIPF
jgi:hypothetical protein